MVRFLTRAALVAGIAGWVLFLSLSGADAASGFGRPVKLTSELTPILDARAPCGDTHPEASATLRLKQQGAETTLRIRLKDARPKTLYTVWLVLAPAGNRNVAPGVMPGVQGNPLTGIATRVTPMVPSEVAASLAGVVDDPNPPNGFRTNAKGDGTFEVDLDFPLLGGAYPFHRVGELLEPPLDLDPVAINFGLFPPPLVFAVVSHCIDDLGHGLTPGPSAAPTTLNERWFGFAPTD